MNKKEVKHVDTIVEKLKEDILEKNVIEDFKERFVLKEVVNCIGIIVVLKKGIIFDNFQDFEEGFCNIIHDVKEKVLHMMTNNVNLNFIVVIQKIKIIHSNTVRSFVRIVLDYNFHIILNF